MSLTGLAFYKLSVFRDVSIRSVFGYRVLRLDIVGVCIFIFGGRYSRVVEKFLLICFVFGRRGVYYKDIFFLGFFVVRF